MNLDGFWLKNFRKFVATILLSWKYKKPMGNPWWALKTAFGAASMPAVYADFKLVINTKLSGGNPIPEMERLVTLFDCLSMNNLIIAASLQGLILLAALPSKWDSVAQLFMQCDNLATNLTFANIRAAITQEYECQGQPVDSSAWKLSAIKHKGSDL